MSRFVKTLALFVAGLQLVPSKASDVLSTMPGITGDGDLKGVTLQPLNGKFDNLFAGHSSHSSHRSHSSHSSHYSGSSGTASRYVAPTTRYTPVAPARSPVQSLQSPAAETTPNAASVQGEFHSYGTTPSDSTRSSTSPTKPTVSHSVGVGDNSRESDVPMTRAEKLRLQLIRVQIRLNNLGLYNGVISGTLDAETSTALRLFQRVKGLEESGQMTTPTLNALAIPSVK